MQAVLVMFRSDGERRSFSMARDMTVIGRREDCDLRIPLGEVSRKHCRVLKDGEMLKIEDLGSSNGTFLNGRRVQEALLSPGDSIQVGPVVFVLQVDGEPADDELNPVTIPAAAATGGAGDSGPLRPSGAAEDDLEALETLEDETEDLEEADELEEISEDESAGSAAARPAAPTAATPDAEEDITELEPLEALDPLEPEADGEFVDEDEGAQKNDNRRMKLEG
jgi:pSer/pThr/pTyr-binding forkhead associated (FHA) protein